MHNDNAPERDENVPQFMTLTEVAERLKVSRSTVNRYITQKDNPMPVIYLSDHTPRVPWDQFEMWVDSLIKESSEKENK